MDKSEIGTHLTGLPPATARGLHNLFNKLLDEIKQLRQAAHWHAPDAEITPLDPVEEPQPTSDVLPPVVDPAPVEPPEAAESDAPTDVPPAA